MLSHALREILELEQPCGLSTLGSSLSTLGSSSSRRVAFAGAFLYLGTVKSGCRIGLVTLNTTLVNTHSPVRKHLRARIVTCDTTRGAPLSPQICKITKNEPLGVSSYSIFLHLRGSTPTGDEWIQRANETPSTPQPKGLRL